MSVLKLEDILNKNVDKETEPKILPVKKEILPRGKPKSGRIWKSEKQRFRSIRKTRGIQISNSLEKHMKLREDLKRVKTISRALEAERKEAKEAKKQRRRDNLERQKKNQLKSEIVQVIKNSAKVKRMRKKQLRNIAKRDTTEISNK